MTKRVLLIAGEVSGDQHAAGLVQALRRRAPDVAFWGIGGDALQAAGMRIEYHVREMAVLGLAEVLRRYFFFRRVFQDMVAKLDRERPDAVLLVDYPGFNLRFAREAHRRGIKVLYYICPQVWAWHRSRIYTMAEVVDRLMVIFPFEPDVFAGTRLKVDFVGHPLVDVIAAAKKEPPIALPWPGDVPVALLPGSRVQEVKRILPPMLGAARLLQDRFPGAGFLVAAPNEDIRKLADDILQRKDLRTLKCRVLSGVTRHVLRQARAAMVASGTATVETALLGCPMIIVYRTAAPTYWLGRWLVKVEHLGMVNLILGRPACPEFIQYDARPKPMAEAMEKMLEDTDARRRMLADLEEMATRLGTGGASEHAARIVSEELGLSS